MNLGTLTATIDADTKGFVTGMAQAAARMESFAREVKKVGQEIGGAAMGLVGFAAAAVHEASKADAGIAAELQKLKDAFTTLALQVAQLVMPVMKELTGVLKAVADWFAGLSPEVRSSIGHWAAMALEVAGVVIVVGKVAGVLGAVAGVFAGVGEAIAAIGVGSLVSGLLGAVVVIAAVAAAAIALRNAWVSNWGDIQGKTKAVLEWIQSAAAQVATFIGKSLSGVVHFFTEAIRMNVELIANILHALGITAADNFLAGVKDVANWGDYVITPEGLKEIAADFKTAGTSAKNWFKKGLGDLSKDLGLDKILGIFSSNGGHARAVGGGDRDKGKLTDADEWNDIYRSFDELKDNTYATAQALHEMASDTDLMNSAFAAVTPSIEAAQKANEDWAKMQDWLNRREISEAEQLNEAIKKTGRMFLSLGQDLASKVGGGLGNTINAGISGGQTGGVWGALLAVILEIISSFKRWHEITDLANEQFQTLLDDLTPALNTVTDAFKELMRGIGSIAKALHPIISVVIQTIARGFHVLAPVFKLIGEILGPIGEIISAIFQLVGVVEDLVDSLGIIDFLMMGLAATILFAEKGLAEIANWFGAGIDTEAMKEKLDKYGNAMFNGGANPLKESADKAADSVDTLGEAAAQVAEQLLNVPQAYRVALARYNAQGVMHSGLEGAYLDERRDNFLNTGNPTKPKSPQKK